MAHADHARRIGAFLLTAGLLAACTSANTGAGGTNATAVQRTSSLPPSQVISAVHDAAASEYRVGPSDLIEISVFQVAELSKVVKVSASGEIAMPLIGTVAVGGKTVSEVEREIAAKLGARYLQSPQVSVFVKEANSQRVTVDGAVKTSGMIALSGRTTLLQAIALSGGLDKGADARGILVFRTVDQRRMAAKFDLAAIRKGTAEDPVLYGGDVVVVDRSGIRSAISDVKEGLPVFGLFSALML